MSDTSLSFQTTSLAHFADILVIDRPWKNQTSAGYCERPFDSLKSFYRAISAGGAALNREHFFISAVVQLCLSPSIGDPRQTLRYAWKTLRYDFPQTAAYGQGDTYIYEVPTASIIGTWPSETFVIEQATSPITIVCGESVPPELAKMHYFPHTSDILFRSFH